MTTPVQLQQGELVVAPAGTKLDAMLDQLAAAMGTTREAAEQFATAVGTAAEKLQTSPQAELRWRLNEQLQGRDPGKPYNWRGL